MLARFAIVLSVTCTVGLGLATAKGDDDRKPQAKNAGIRPPQATTPAKGKDDFIDCKTAETRELMRKPTLDIQKSLRAPLKEVLVFLSAKCKCRIRCEENVFAAQNREEDRGVMGSQDVTLPPLKGATLEKALEQILRPMNAGYYFDQGEICIVPRNTLLTRKVNFSYEDQPAKVVLQELADRSNVEIKLAKGLGDKKISGNLRGMSVKDAMGKIAAAGGLKVKLKGETFEISRK